MKVFVDANVIIDLLAERKNSIQYNSLVMQMNSGV